MGAKVAACRAKELVLLRRYIMIQAVVFVVQTSAPVLVTISTFAAYVGAGRSLDVKTAFVCLALFDIIRDPLWGLTTMINSVTEARVSLQRLEGFLREEEMGAPAAGSGSGSGCAGVELRGADFSWLAGAGPGAQAAAGGVEAGAGLGPPTAAADLAGVTLAVPAGEFVAVVGHVGSGKTSLLAAVLGEMTLLRGGLSVGSGGGGGGGGGGCAYVAQLPFIMNATLRENVTFLLPFDAERYQVRDSLLHPTLTGGTPPARARGLRAAA